MMTCEHPTVAAPVADEATRPIKAAEITVRGRMVHGTEARVMGVLDTVEVEIFGSRSCFIGDTEMVMVVVSDGSVAREALESAGLECQKISSVLVAPSLSGEAKVPFVACLARAGVGILYCYTLFPDRGGEYLVFKTVDDDLALRLIEGEQVARAA